MPGVVLTAMLTTFTSTTGSKYLRFASAFDLSYFGKQIIAGSRHVRGIKLANVHSVALNNLQASAGDVLAYESCSTLLCTCAFIGSRDAWLQAASLV